MRGNTNNLKIIELFREPRLSIVTDKQTGANKMINTLYTLKVTTPSNKVLNMYFVKESDYTNAHYKAEEMGCTTNYWDRPQSTYAIFRDMDEVESMIKSFS